MSECSECKREVQPGRPGTYTRIKGWDTPRAAGGTNHIVLRETEDEYLCSSCAAKLTSGINTKQGAML